MMTLPTLAQSDSASNATAFDPAALARRLMGVTTPEFVPPATPQYKVGDQLEFTVGKTTSNEPTKIKATLAGTAGNIYLWVEDGLTFKPDEMAQVADVLDRVLNVVRWRSTYTADRQLPGAAGQIFDPTNLYPLPDIDNDPHIFFVYTTNLADDRSGVYNPYDSQPVAEGPGGFSNQHEVIAINTSPYQGTALSDNLLTDIAIRALFDMVMLTNNTGQPAWLREALGWYLLLQIEQTPLTADDAASYLNAPDTPLTQPSTLTTAAQSRTGQQLFLNYFEQRYGTAALLDVFTASGVGLEPFSSVLAKRRVVDPVNGANVTGIDTFAEFLLTNGVNGLFGDGRFFHLNPRLNQGEVAAGTVPPALTQTHLVGQKVNQYGATYLRGSISAPGAVKITFDGQPTSPRLSMPASSAPDNHFYWSGGGRGRDAMLTRSFDLSAVKSATLTFDAWYNLADGWNYGYVEVSKDGGATWQIVKASGDSANNRNGVAYGPGLTGISNPQGPQPFPIMGVLIASDGVTINQIVSDGPAAKTDMAPNDQIIGYDGKPWPGPPDIIGLLGEHNPGDTINFLVKRGDKTFDAPLVLGAHPTRIKEPQPLWQAQTVDLSAFAGSTIQVRFEVVSVPNRDDQGVAIDNVAVPELNFKDDAEADGDWTLGGWQRIDNHVTQRYLVEAATSGSQSHLPTARALIGPGDGTVSGEWSLLLDNGETLTLVVSAVSDETSQPATYSLQVTQG